MKRLYLKSGMLGLLTGSLAATTITCDVPAEVIARVVTYPIVVFDHDYDYDDCCDDDEFFFDFDFGGFFDDCCW